MRSTTTWRIRTAMSADRAFLEQLAPRLTIGLAAWRDPAAMEATARRWLLSNLEHMGPESTVFIAESPDGVPVGAATVERSKHFTGAPQAELGELVVVEAAEGQGVGSALLAAVEDWTRAQGLPFLSLGTGAANTRARAFYARHGFGEEDLRLTKVL